MTDEGNFLSVQIPQFEGKKIRMGLTEGGDPLFHMTDVYTALEYEAPKVSSGDFRRTLDEEETAIYTVFTSQDLRVRNSLTLDFTPNPRGEFMVTEAGMNAVVVACKKPIGKRLRLWLFSEVMPSIRRTGSYSALKSKDPKKLSLAEHRMLLAQYLAALDMAEEQEAIVAAQKEIIAEKDEIIEVKDLQLRRLTFNEDWIGLRESRLATGARECDTKMFLNGRGLAMMLRVARKRRYVPKAGVVDLVWGYGDGYELIETNPKKRSDPDTPPDLRPGLWLHERLVAQAREFLVKIGPDTTVELTKLSNRALRSDSLPETKRLFEARWKAVTSQVPVPRIHRTLAVAPNLSIGGRRTPLY